MFFFLVSSMDFYERVKKKNNKKKISWVELRGRVEICLAASQRSIQHLYALASLHFLLRSPYIYNKIAEERVWSFTLF